MHSTAANSILKGRPSFLEAVHGLCGLWSLLEATPSSVFFVCWCGARPSDGILCRRLVLSLMRLE
jgi:hypothetical protein